MSAMVTASAWLSAMSSRAVLTMALRREGRCAGRRVGVVTSAFYLLDIVSCIDATPMDAGLLETT